jgi:D-glycero-D-manno-heptose 1,7-bisphosphate phosphatase
LKKAVFCDRDGVLNELVYREEGKEFEPPHSVEELKFFERVFDGFLILQNSGFEIFIVSNQPDFAKGKTGYSNIISVSEKFKNVIEEKGIKIREFYYCFHHPEAILDDLRVKCECRKPGTKFVEEAINKYIIDRNISFFIGDRNSDILCGKRAGLKTILVRNPDSDYKEDENKPDYESDSFFKAVKIIINNTQ